MREIGYQIDHRPDQHGLHLHNIALQGLSSGTPVIRVMPNMPALVGCGATVFARGSHAGDAEAAIANRLFCSVGICEEVAESMIDPVTALAGSGPAYVSSIEKQPRAFLRFIIG